MPEVQTPTGVIAYALKRGSRRSIALRVSPDGSVTVHAPRWALRIFIERFVRQQAEWIAIQLRRFAEIARQHPPKQFIAGEPFWVAGFEVPLDIAVSPDVVQPGCEGKDGRLKVVLNPHDAESAEVVKAALKRWFWEETEKRVTQAVERFSPQLQVFPRKIRIANQNARWGSCSIRGDLRFNWRLSMTPLPVLEGVVVHELAHLRVHDHSPRFWDIVASILPDHKERRNWLRKHGRSLGF